MLFTKCAEEPVLVTAGSAELRSAWTGEGARPHTSTPVHSAPIADEKPRPSRAWTGHPRESRPRESRRARVLASGNRRGNRHVFIRRAAAVAGHHKREAVDNYTA